MVRDVAELRLRPFRFEIVRGIYRGIVEDCRHRGVVPVWIYLPIPGVLRIRGVEDEVEEMTKEMIEAAKEAGFLVVDLRNWSDGFGPARVRPNAVDPHLNALGHQVIADRLYTLLHERPELLPPFARLPRAKAPQP
jgi:hypothetical protein